MATASAQENPVLGEVERLGFKYQLDPQYDLDLLDKDRRVQVRESKHYAPRAEVRSYAAQMAFSVFPPIIVTKDGWLVDGNTRVAARLDRKEKFFPAYVLNTEFGGGSEKRKEELYALASAINQLNGRRLTAAEEQAEARRMIGMNWKSEAIQRQVGIGPSVVAAIRKEIEAEQKLARVGLGSNGEVKTATKRALGHRDVQALNDAPFRELARLATDADLKAGEIVNIAKRIKESGSDDAGAQMLAGMRDDFGEQIRQKQLTGKGKPPAAAQLRQALGNVVKYQGDEAALVEINPIQIEPHRAVIETAIDVLRTALEEQDRHDNDGK